jgi:phosphoribosyl-dephospho-CoA transferase
MNPPSNFGSHDALLPHDLAELAERSLISALGPDVALSPWAVRSLIDAPFVVARRARNRGDLLPVGIRGHVRYERLAGWLRPAAVKRRIRPEQLVRDEAWRFTPRAASLPHFALLDRIGAFMNAFGFIWGPVGSIGFEVATGAAVASPGSDIDLILRAPQAIPYETARALRSDLGSLPIRVDVQLETPCGAVALAEYVTASTHVALRTLDGPTLVRDPWEAAFETDNAR